MYRSRRDGSRFAVDMISRVRAYVHTLRDTLFVGLLALVAAALVPLPQRRQYCTGWGRVGCGSSDRSGFFFIVLSRFGWLVEKQTIPVFCFFVYLVVYFARSVGLSVGRSFGRFAFSGGKNPVREALVLGCVKCQPPVLFTGGGQ